MYDFYQVSYKDYPIRKKNQNPIGNAKTAGTVGHAWPYHQPRYQVRNVLEGSEFFPAG